jgi:hypothetical protein
MKRASDIIFGAIALGLFAVAAACLLRPSARYQAVTSEGGGVYVLDTYTSDIRICNVRTPLAEEHMPSECGRAIKAFP